MESRDRENWRLFRK